MNKSISAFNHIHGGFGLGVSGQTGADHRDGTGRHPLRLHSGAVASLSTGPFGALRRVALAFILWNDARATRNVLSKLSDHELDDIGLSREEVGEMCREAARSLNA
jgi:uncharacterized protein YjiS (DUF1127 family)